MGSTRRTCRVESCRVEPSGIWAITARLLRKRLRQRIRNAGNPASVSPCVYRSNDGAVAGGRRLQIASVILVHADERTAPLKNEGKKPAGKPEYCSHRHHYHIRLMNDLSAAKHNTVNEYTEKQMLMPIKIKS